MTTSANTQFHVAKELVDHTLGFTISVDLYYDPATLNTSSYYNFINGRGNNTGFHSGMMIPGGLNESNFVGFWRNNSDFSAISKSGLTADWYRYSMIVTATTVQIKLLNLRTNVLLEGNIATVGTIDIADNINFTFLCYGINGVTGAYGSVGVNVANIRILRGSTCLLNVPLSEGVGDKVTDICNSSQYQITFFTVASGWAKLSNYFHHNFRYGFTLYQKSGSANLYIPNTSSQTEISITPPSGYSRVANYKECRQAFNQCESKFKLDDVAVQTIVLSGALTLEGYNGTYIQNGTGAGNPKYDKIDDPTKNIWKGASPYDIYGWTIGDIAYIGYWFENINGDGDGLTPFPWNVASFTPFGLVGATGTVTVTLNPSGDLYNSDPDHVLFVENTGVAKEIEIQDLCSDIVDSTLDRGHLYINSDSDKNLMLYKTDKGVDTREDLKVWKYVNKE